MNIEKTCPICGSTYSISEARLRHNRGLTCSYECGRKLAAQKLSRPAKERVKVICKQCGKVEYLPPYRAKDRLYCSLECSGLAQQNKVTIKCARCGKEFERAPWHAKRDQIHYCSKECQFPPAVITCDNCGKTKKVSPSAIGEHNFCSRKCTRAWQQKNGIVGVPYARVIVNCATCGKELELEQNQVNKSGHNYCNRACFFEAHRINMAGEDNPVWRGGFDPYYGPNWKRQSYEARKRDSFTCQRCGIHESSLSKKLDVHHIKPLREFNRDFKRANAIGNLVSLCPACHKFVEWHQDQLSPFPTSNVAKTQP